MCLFADLFVCCLRFSLSLSLSFIQILPRLDSAISQLVSSKVRNVAERKSAIEAVRKYIEKRLSNVLSSLRFAVRHAARAIESSLGVAVSTHSSVSAWLASVREARLAQPQAASLIKWHKNLGGLLRGGGASEWLDALGLAAVAESSDAVRDLKAFIRPLDGQIIESRNSLLQSRVAAWSADFELFTDMLESKKGGTQRDSLSPTALTRKVRVFVL